MSSFLLKTQSFVNNAESVQDLISILKLIPLQNVKGLINESLQLMHENTIRSGYFRSCSIHNIISDDVVKSIINYIPHEDSLKYVNKAFNKFMKENSELKMRLRKRNISSKFKGKNIWIVDPLRNHLNAEEIKIGAKGPIKSLDKALELIESGDKIILSKGIHKMDKPFSFYEKEVQIEGMGKDSVLERGYNLDDLDVNKQLSLSNLMMNWASLRADSETVWLTDCIYIYGDVYGLYTCGALDCVGCRFVEDVESDSGSAISTYSKLSIINCVFDICGKYDNNSEDPTIYIANAPDITFDCIGCKFVGKSKSGSRSAIYVGEKTYQYGRRSKLSVVDCVGESSKLSVIDCVFNNCGGYECEECQPTISLNNAENVSLKIIGNVFKNLKNATIPIADKNGESIKVNDEAIVNHNYHNTFDAKIFNTLK